MKSRIILFSVLIIIFTACMFVIDCMLCDVANASEISIDMHALSSIESSCNPNAISFIGAKYGRGLYQISEIALKEYNNYHTEERYAVQELFNPEINGKVAQWLLNERIPQLLRFYGHDITVGSILNVYNIGIGSYNKGKRNNNYVKKYTEAL